jgi:agmatine/peptidylarginine deiminase
VSPVAPRKRPPRLIPLLLLLCFPAASRAQDAHSSTDVVLLALQPLNAQTQAHAQVRAGLLSGSADLDVEKHLLETQLRIVRATANFGPVLLLAPDDTTKDAVYQRCAEFQLCELFAEDHLRIKVAAHDGVWIRDFGPQITATAAGAAAVHWRYFDLRLEEAKREKQRELETARLHLLAAREREDQPETLSPHSDPAAHASSVSAIDAKLFVLKEYSQLLSETSPQRGNDESSAFDIADAVLAAPDFPFHNSALALDGGNLFKLDDGRCLTTRTLRVRNKEQNLDVVRELETSAGCKQVTFLEPLPGPVIEHVDMFLLPVGGNRLLLASYDLSEPFAAKYWRVLSDEDRRLALDASLAMDANADVLRRLGYDVIRVPSPFPRTPPNGHVYYPSLLNALVRTGPAGFRQILVPQFPDDEVDIQSAALQKITAAFGPNSQIVPIESTAAAKAQGAIHCLTLSVPLSVSIFADAAASARRATALARKHQLDLQNPVPTPLSASASGP